MLPATWVGLLLFFLFIAPGLLFDLLAARRRAAQQESVFREISRILLTGTAFSVAALGALAVVRARSPNLMPDPRLLLGRDSALYITNNYTLVFTALAAQVALSVLLAGAAHLVLARAQGGAPIKNSVSSWTKVFRRDCPQGCAPIVRVRLANGVVVCGRVADFSADLDVEDRQLTLAPPLSAAGDPQTPLQPLPTGWCRTILKAEDIVLINVQYAPKALLDQISSENKPRSSPGENNADGATDAASGQGTVESKFWSP